MVAAAKTAEVIGMITRLRATSLKIVSGVTSSVASGG